MTEVGVRRVQGCALLIVGASALVGYLAFWIHLHSYVIIGSRAAFVFGGLVYFGCKIALARQRQR